MAGLDMNLLDTHLGSGDISNLDGGAACKRRGIGQEDAVTMTMLREILGEQSKTVLAQQREIRTEIRTLEQTFQGEIKTLERSRTAQFQDLHQGVQAAERGILDM